MHLLAILTLLLAPLLAHAGMYTGPVIDLDAKTFKRVMADEHAAMVAFIAPWCGHCKNLGPEYSAAAQSLAPLIPFYTVDCDASQNKGLCAEFQVQGFPTIKAFPRAGKGAAKDYNGERKRNAIVEYAKTLVPDRVRKLRADDGVELVINRFLEEKPTLPHVLLIHPSAPSIPFLWKVLAHRLSSKINFGYIRDTSSHEVLSAVGVYNPQEARDTVRAVYWEPGVTNRVQVAQYDGVLKFNGLLEWLLNAIGENLSPSSDKKPKTSIRSEETKPSVSSSTNEDTASRRAKLQAKLDEEDRRDRARREKIAAQRAAEVAAAGESMRNEKSSDSDEEVVEETLIEEIEVVDPTRVDEAPAAEPEEDVENLEEEVIEQTVYYDDAPEPVPEQEPGHLGDEL